MRLSVVSLFTWVYALGPVLLNNNGKSAAKNLFREIAKDEAGGKTRHKKKSAAVCENYLRLLSCAQTEFRISPLTCILLLKFAIRLMRAYLKRSKIIGH